MHTAAKSTHHYVKWIYTLLRTASLSSQPCILATRARLRNERDASSARMCLALVLFLALVCVTWALESNLCIRRSFDAVTQYARVYGQEHQPTAADCQAAVCGRLDTSYEGPPFLQRLSPQCRAQMEQYRSSHAKSAGRVMKAENKRGKCAKRPNSITPSNPVVIDGHNSAPFIMCTVPKVGCTNFRCVRLGVSTLRV